MTRSGACSPLSLYGSFSFATVLENPPKARVGTNLRTGDMVSGNKSCNFSTSVAW